MKPTNSPDTTDFEEQTRHLLERYAEGMPSETSVEARVRTRLAAQEPQRHAVRQRSAPRWSLDGWARGAISLALVIVLVAGFAAVLHARQNRAPGKGVVGGKTASCATIEPNHTIKLCAAQHVDATITLEQAYADATRTEVEMRLTLTGADLRFSGDSAPIPPVNVSAVGILQDSEGHQYARSDFSNDFNYGQGLAPGNSGPNTPIPGYFAFDPLPQSMLSSPQTLTLRIYAIELGYPSRKLPSTLILNGSWTYTFQVTPRAGRSIHFNVAPQTFSGITVQPLRLDIGPKDGNNFDALGGGARLTLRISGLPADTRASTLDNLSVRYFVKPGGGMGGSGDEANQLLFEGQLPASVVWMFPSSSLAQDPQVGPSGTIDLEAIFLGLPKLSGTQPLMLTQLTTGQSDGTFTFAHGPWNFALPLG